MWTGIAAWVGSLTYLFCLRNCAASLYHSCPSSVVKSMSVVFDGLIKRSWIDLTRLIHSGLTVMLSLTGWALASLLNWSTVFWASLTAVCALLCASLFSSLIFCASLTFASAVFLALVFVFTSLVSCATTWSWFCAVWTSFSAFLTLFSAWLTADWSLFTRSVASLTFWVAVSALDCAWLCLLVASANLLWASVTAPSAVFASACAWSKAACSSAEVVLCFTALS